VSFVKDLPNQQQEPFLSKSTRIYSFLADEFDLQAFFDITLSRPNNFADATKSVVQAISRQGTQNSASDPMQEAQEAICHLRIIHQAIPSHLQDQELAHGFVAENAIEESLSCFDFHLPSGLHLHEVDLCVDAQEEGILTE